MKRFSLYLLGLGLAVAPVMAAKVEGSVITLEPQEVSGCQSGGGCVLIPKRLLRDMLQQAQAAKCTRI